jgi:formamidopyrimidine-DNA glycosylase
MPELPEVEITRENLEAWLAGRRILEVRVIDGRVLTGQSARRMSKVLTGATVRTVSRRGKFLLWDLGRRGGIVTHLGMSGKYVLLNPKSEDRPYSRIVFRLARGRRLAFVDPRRLGSVRLLDEMIQSRLRRLGIEPLGAEFTADGLADLLNRANSPVKTFLMDQQRLAGLGNIYAAEALFRARIHPGRPANRLLPREIRALHRAIRDTLTTALEKERSDEIHYLQEAHAPNDFLVYGRRGKPCTRCREPVDRLTQSGRSTYYCPRCQPMNRSRRKRRVSKETLKRG